MNEITIISTKQFNGKNINILGFQDNFALTRNQIGVMLGYSDPQKAIENIHARNKGRLDQLSTTLKMRAIDGKSRDVTVYCFKGLLEICRHSNQPNANSVIDFCWEVIDEIRRTGKYEVTKSLEQLTLEVIQSLNERIAEQQRLIAETQRLSEERGKRIDNAIVFYKEKKNALALVEGLSKENTIKIPGISVTRVLSNLGVMDNSGKKPKPLGRTTLYAFLRERGWLTKGKRTHATQSAIDHGYMVDDIYVGKNKYTEEGVNGAPTPRFLVKGIIKICECYDVKCTADDVIAALEQVQLEDGNDINKQE